jgi:GNAT superfamily N-acetyltransferase
MHEAERVLPFLKDPNNFYLLATDAASGTPAGYIWWKHQPCRSPDKWAQIYANRFRPPGMNKALMDATSGERFLRGAKIIGDQTVVVMRELYVRPEYQREGIGGKLVQRVVQYAAEHGLMTYTEATSQAKSLYLRHGFKVVDLVRVELEPWGGKEGQVSEYWLLTKD